MVSVRPMGRKGGPSFEDRVKVILALTNTIKLSLYKTGQR